MLMRVRYTRAHMPMPPPSLPELGASRQDGQISVRAWAPGHRELVVHLYGEGGEREEARVPMQAGPDDVFEALFSAPAGALLYKLSVDGEGPFPDPWSRAQPFGVHGPSSLPPDRFAWT